MNSMLKDSIVFGAVATLVLAVSAARAQGFSALPVEGAPLARPGPYEVVSERAFGSPGHIVFRPASLDRFPREDTLPVMVWANGGCASDSSLYAAFLTTIASHGFLVLATAPVNGASQPFPTGDSAPPGYDRFTSPFRAALDWAESETVRDGSPMKGKVATDRMAAMGLSCGGGVAVMIGADRRIDTVGVISSAAWGSIHLNGDQRCSGVLRRPAQRGPHERSATQEAVSSRTLPRAGSRGHSRATPKPAQCSWDRVVSSARARIGRQDPRRSSQSIRSRVSARKREKCRSAACWSPVC